MFERKLFILSIVFFTLILYLSGCSTLFSPDQPKAEKGILDLTQWQFEEDGVIKLNGQWEFYWNQLLEPHQLEDTSKRRVFFKYIHYPPLAKAYDPLLLFHKMNRSFRLHLHICRYAQINQL